VVTGDGTTGTCTDWLALLGQTPVALSHPALATENDHGTGCTYSAALASLLAQGIELETACRCAAAYTSQQLALSRRWELGRGRGPIAHVAASHPSH
jgi:hydroxymethylpyrimidine/phosphomethylpyrimidine kinase